MLYLNDLKFTCKQCRKGHRQYSCVHYERATEGIVFSIGKRGRPRLNEKRIHYLLETADVDEKRTSKCPRANKYKFLCKKRMCCTFDSDKRKVYLDPSKTTMVEVGPAFSGELVAGESNIGRGSTREKLVSHGTQTNHLNSTSKKTKSTIPRKKRIKRNTPKFR